MILDDIGGDQSRIPEKDSARFGTFRPAAPSPGASSSATVKPLTTLRKRTTLQKNYIVLM